MNRLKRGQRIKRRYLFAILCEPSLKSYVIKVTYGHHLATIQYFSDFQVLLRFQVIFVEFCLLLSKSSFQSKLVVQFKNVVY